MLHIQLICYLKKNFCGNVAYLVSVACSVFYPVSFFFRCHCGDQIEHIRCGRVFYPCILADFKNVTNLIQFNENQIQYNYLEKNKYLVFLY